ncbi:MAG: paraquat-inducible protein A [Gammaproteobacteria bacterium]|nr:paraquat-inducible protein A [Gammaproteobacteria bacterium]
MKNMQDKDISIAGNYPTEARWLIAILGMISLFLVTGLVTPVITLEKFMLVENTFSVLGGVIQLLQEEQFFLFLVITGFSIVIPLLKIAVLYKLLSARQDKTAKLDKYLHWMHVYGKWSMLDVFVVAVLVVVVKLGMVASVEMRFGLYAFAAAVILTMYVTARVVSLADSSKQDAERSFTP